MQEPGRNEPTILIIEHDDGVRTLLGARVDRWGYRCILARSPDAGLKAARSLGRVDVVLSDFMPAPGQATLYEQRAELPQESPPLFLCTLGPVAGVPEEVPQVSRPFDMETLHTLIRRLAESSVMSSGEGEDSANAS